MESPPSNTPINPSLDRGPTPLSEKQISKPVFQPARISKKNSLVAKVLLAVVLPIIGVISAYFLLQSNQDLRQRASEGLYGSVAQDTGRSDGVCLGVGEKCTSGTSHFDNSCPVTETRCGSQSSAVVSVQVAVKDGECLGIESGTEQVCESGSGHVDLTCGGRNYRCGEKPTPSQALATPTTSPPPLDKCTQQQHLSCTFGCDSTTGQCKQGKANNELCSNNGECNSLNCVATPGGKYCMAAGTTLSTPVAEGGVCGTTAYNRECQTGLICQANRCVKPTSVQTIPVGSCLVDGANCSGNQGYADTSCGSGIRCGTKPTPTPSPALTQAPTLASTGTTNSLLCLQQQGVWIQNQCWPVGTTATQVITRQNRALNDSCIHNNDCSSGSCSAVGSQRICTPNVQSSGSTPRFANGAACQQDCASQGGDEAICRSICSQYNTSDENLIQVGQAINTLTGGTFADYLATNIQLNNEGLTGWERYTDPRALEANSKFGLVLTAEGALAYTGIGALTGAGSAATFGATANLVNTGYSAYQAQEACAGAITPEEKANCSTAKAYAGLAALNLGVSGWSLAAQNAGSVAQAAQLANQARLANAGVSALEIGANTYQTYQACQGPNANTQVCLIQGGLSVIHGLGSYGDLAYAGNTITTNINRNLDSLISNDLSGIYSYPKVNSSIDDWIVNIDDIIIRRVNSPESLLAEHITGLNAVMESELLAARLLEDNAVIRARYNLPPVEMRLENPVEYMRVLNQRASAEGIAVRPAYETTFFEQNPIAAGVHMSDTNTIFVKPATASTPFENLQFDAETLEHELIHALQRKNYPGLYAQIEGIEYEAYVAGLTPQRLQFYQAEPERAGNLFGYYGIGGSVEFYYDNKGIVPQWLINN